MELHIDWTACDGRGICAELLPEMLAEDDWGYPIVLGEAVVPAHLEPSARRAVHRCPALAFQIKETRRPTPASS